MFQPIISDLPINEIPIFLIDVSGSTDSLFQKGKISFNPAIEKPKCKLTVMEYEFDLALSICDKFKYEKAHVITWSTKAELFENQTIKNIQRIKKKSNSNGGTELKCGLKLIKDEFFDKNTITKIIIITDGEISDNNTVICNQLNELSKHNICIEIIAVETNKNDYSNANVSVGNAIYRMIKNNNMTRLVNKFSVYNANEIEFINFSNPRVKDGFIPYYDNMFSITDLKHFIEHINQSIKEIMENNDDTLKFRIIKFVQNLSLSLYHITKNQSHQYQLSMVELFCNMFKDTEHYASVRSILLNEVNNHIVGKASTYQELRKERHTKIENTNIDLMINTEKAICGNDDNLNQIKYSFLLMDNDNKHLVIESNDDILSDIKLGFTTYKNASAKIENYCVPVMFNFLNNSSAALQWMKFNYSRKINISISNEHIYYYLLCDAHLVRNNQQLSKIYDKYITCALNDTKYGSQVTILGEMKKNKSIAIPYGILHDATKYYNHNIKPLVLYYMICNKYLLSHLDNNQFVIDSLRKYCEKDIMNELNLESIDNWDDINEKLESIYNDNVQIIQHNSIEKNILLPHKYLNLDFDCSGKNAINSDDGLACDVCNCKISYTKFEKTIDIPNLSNIKDNYIFNLKKHIDLGLLDGMPNNKLINVENFESDYDSFSVNNTMIIDPISNSRLKIKSQEEFLQYVNLKYPFLKNVDMTNVALCGGFVRSILLKQQMKDFDFFFYGLENEQKYVERVKTLTTNVMKSLKDANDKLKFAFFYKPLFNVLEMICYEDPSNFIQEDYTLEFFDKYTFKSMKKYKARDVVQKVQNDVNDSDNDSDNDSNHSDDSDDSNDSDDSDDQIENNLNNNHEVDKKYYFEDGDKNGIKMIHRMQFIMCKYETIFDIFKSFDMFPSQTAFDGSRVHFTEKSLMSFQYMINEINMHGGTSLIKHRSSKYFKYGFSIVFPNTDRNWNSKGYDNKSNQEHMYYSGTNENIGPLKFKVRRVDGNMIYINHNSNLEHLLERNESLEKKAKDEGVSLYTSTLFCSFVAVLRYVKINNINYAFPQNDKLDDLFEDEKINLKNGAVKLSFLDRQTSIYPTTQWYPEFINTIVLENY